MVKNNNLACKYPKEVTISPGGYGEQEITVSTHLREIQRWSKNHKGVSTLSEDYRIAPNGDILFIINALNRNYAPTEVYGKTKLIKLNVYSLQIAYEKLIPKPKNLILLFSNSELIIPIEEALRDEYYLYGKDILQGYGHLILNNLDIALKKRNKTLIKRSRGKYGFDIN